AESAQPQRPSVAMSEPKEHADSAPKPSIAMSEPKDTKSQASTSGETQRPVVKNQRKQSGSLSVVQVRMTRPKFPSGAITNHRKMMMKVGMLRGGIIRKPP